MRATRMAAAWLSVLVPCLACGGGDFSATRPLTDEQRAQQEAEASRIQAAVGEPPARPEEVSAEPQRAEPEPEPDPDARCVVDDGVAYCTQCFVQRFGDQVDTVVSVNAEASLDEPRPLEEPPAGMSEERVDCGDFMLDLPTPLASCRESSEDRSVVTSWFSGEPFASDAPRAACERGGGRWTSVSPNYGEAVRRAAEFQARR